MKPIMSFWSEPYIRTKYNNWSNPDSFGLSWILSVAAITKVYGKPHLYTDEIGKHFLVDQLGLDFASVDLSLNELRGRNPQFFSLGKTYAIGIQKEPFVHIDYDAYLFGTIPQELIASGVFFEKEVFCDLNKSDILLRPESLSSLKGLPDWWKLGITNKQTKMYKSGIVSGSNYEFFSRLSQSIFDIINSNSDSSFFDINSDSKKGVFAGIKQFVPQYLLDEYLPFALAKSMNIIPRFMITNSGSAMTNYSHVHGEKNSHTEMYGRILRRLISDFPETIPLIDNLKTIKVNKIPKVSVIVMANDSSSCYDSVLRTLIPRKMAPNEVFVSSYKLNVTDRQLLSKIDGVRIIPEGENYLASLENVFRKTSGQLIIVVDGHVRVPKQYIEKFIAGYMEHPKTVFCTASSDFSDKPNHVSYGYLKDDSGVRPNLAEKMDNIFDMPKVQGLFGGIVAFPSEALHSLFDPVNKILDFTNISERLEDSGYGIRCVKSILASHNFKRTSEFIVP